MYIFIFYNIYFLYRLVFRPTNALRLTSFVGRYIYLTLQHYLDVGEIKTLQN